MCVSHIVHEKELIRLLGWIQDLVKGVHDLTIGAHVLNLAMPTIVETPPPDRLVRNSYITGVRDV